MSRAKEQEIVTAFSKAMMQKLDKRSDKGRVGWRERTFTEVWLHLREEIDELVTAESDDDIKEEVVDVALLAMMIWDKINDEDV